MYTRKEVGVWSKVGNALSDPTVIGTLFASKGSGATSSLSNIAKGATLSADRNMLYNVASQWAMQGEIDYRDVIASGIVGGVTGVNNVNTSTKKAIAESPTWSSHGYKHFPARNKPWNV